jgi:DNA-3-methyladenine glycosylase II
MEWNYNEALKHFEKKDPKVALLMHEIGELGFISEKDYFISLVNSIISQQVSVKAAESIFKKLESGLKGALTPSAILSCSPEGLRAFGVSPQKAKYLLDLAHHFQYESHRFQRLEELTDDEVIEALVQIKGIGKWTAQMFLMFTLGRKDVFAPDDLGIRNAMMRLYGWKQIPTKDKMERKSKTWSPYKTIACRYLWKSLNNKPD